MFVLTPDDKSVVRGKAYRTPRDNLLFELGLAVAFLGRDRVFIVKPSNLDLKLPRDLDAVVYGTFNQDAPNKIAATSTACGQIRTAFKSTGSRTLDSIRSSLASVLGNIHVAHQHDFTTIFERLMIASFARGVIRRNWNIDLSYNIPTPIADLIEERLIWQYEFVNITSKPLSYPLTLFTGRIGFDELISLTRTDVHGKSMDVFHASETTISGEHFFRKHERMIELIPGEQWSLRMNFVNIYPVSPRAHYIQNALAPTVPALNAQITVRVPEGYRVDLLATDVVTPKIFGDSWQFQIPGPLLPEQILEYIFQKQSYYDETRR